MTLPASGLVATGWPLSLPWPPLACRDNPRATSGRDGGQSIRFERSAALNFEVSRACSHGWSILGYCRSSRLGEGLRWSVAYGLFPPFSRAGVSRKRRSDLDSLAYR